MMKLCKTALEDLGEYAGVYFSPLIEWMDPIHETKVQKKEERKELEGMNPEELISASGQVGFKEITDVDRTKLVMAQFRESFEFSKRHGLVYVEYNVNLKKKYDMNLCQWAEENGYVIYVLDEGIRKVSREDLVLRTEPVVSLYFFPKSMDV